MVPVLELPVDLFLSIFLHLSIRDVLNLRQTCKGFLEITQLRSVWHLLLTTNILERNIPIPGFNRLSIESLTASELEQLAFQALQLRRTWTQLSPTASNEYTLKCDVLPTRLGVVALEFIPGRGNRYLLSLALASNLGRLYSLQCWDLEASPPDCIAMRTVQQCGWFILNTDHASPTILAIQSPAIELLDIDFSGTNPMTGFVRTTTIEGRTDTLQGLHGSTVLTTDDQNRVHMWDTGNPNAHLELRSPNGESEMLLGVIIQDQFAIVIRRTALEIYGTHSLGSESPSIVVSPIVVHRWMWKLDSVSMAPQASCVTTRSTRPPPINVLIRYGSLLPWPVNLLHHYVLHPNGLYDASRPVDASNVPYEVTLATRRTIGSPIRLFATYHMAMGRYGTAVWIDSHTEDYFGRTDRGQRLAGSLLLAADGDLQVGDDHEEVPEARVESTMESTVFLVSENDNWTRLAVSEEEGRIAVGSVNGTITVLEYA